MTESVYKSLSEAQLLIDPSSIPNARTDVQADPQAAVSILFNLLGKRGINSYERAQTWNTLAFAYYTLGDVDQTIGAYEAVLRETITEALELSTLRALFQLNYGKEDYQQSLDYIERWQRLSGTADPDVTFIKATAYYQLQDYESALRESLAVENMATARGSAAKENWLYLQVVLYNELGDLENVEQVLIKLNSMYPKEQYRTHLASLRSGGAVQQETVEVAAHPVFDLDDGRLILRADNVEGFRNAGITAGSHIMGIKFEKVSSWSDIAELDLRPGSPITLEVDRGQGSTFLPVRLTPADIDLILTPVSAGVEIVAEVEVGSGGFGIADGEYLPIVKVAPVYPRRALSRGMSGWVQLEFTVTKQGTVRDPVVVGNCAWIKSARTNGECFNSPNSIFDSAAMRAVEKFKYKPKVIDGEPVETAGVQNKISFDLVQ
jgi:tetratricopeptide (TPR) repeat protein